jgi:hypothetical protein
MPRLPLVPELSKSLSPLLSGEDPWQMGFGERAAIVGLLSELRPGVAIEIGTAEGGSLRRIAEYSEQVHSFDLLEPDPELRKLANVEFHVGDSHALLPELLARLAAEGANVDFVLVDGDHSAEGVARDMRDLFDSPAIGRTVVVMHDTMNEEVRRGLEAVDYAAWEKVRYVELDCVSGYLFKPPLERELWAGLGLVVVDETNPRRRDEPVRQQRYHDSQPLMVLARERVAQQELAALRADLERREADVARLQEGIDVLRASASWRLTTPLRRLKRLFRG